jgi:hypothetical protein
MLMQAQLEVGFVFAHDLVGHLGRHCLSSSRSTVAPNTTLPPASSVDGSMIWAVDSLLSIFLACGLR